MVTIPRQSRGLSVLEPLEAAGLFRRVGASRLLLSPIEVRPSLPATFRTGTAESARPCTNVALHTAVSRFTPVSVNTELQELSNFYCHPGRAGGSPLVARAKALVVLPCRTPESQDQTRASTPFRRVISEHLALPANEQVVCGMSRGYADPNAVENCLVTGHAPLSGFAHCVDREPGWRGS